VLVETLVQSAWIQRLTSRYDKLLSRFAFSFTLRPYTEEQWREVTAEQPMSREAHRQRARKCELDKLSYLTRADPLAAAVPPRRRAALIAEGLHAAWHGLTLLHVSAQPGCSIH